MWDRQTQRVNICKTETRHTHRMNTRETDNTHTHTHTGWGEYTWDSLRVICCLDHQSNKERRYSGGRTAVLILSADEVKHSLSMARQGGFGADCQHAYIHVVYEHVLLWNVKPDPWLLPYIVWYMHLLPWQYDISWDLCHTERVIDLHQLLHCQNALQPLAQSCLKLWGETPLSLSAFVYDQSWYQGHQAWSNKNTCTPRFLSKRPEDISLGLVYVRLLS